MKPADRYHRFVRWSDEDQSYIGYCPDLYFGGVCHGDQEEKTYADLCTIVRDEIAHRLAQGEALPKAQTLHEIISQPDRPFSAADRLSREELYDRNGYR